MTSSLGHVMPSSAAITPEPHLGTMPVRIDYDYEHAGKMIRYKLCWFKYQNQL